MTLMKRSGGNVITAVLIVAFAAMTTQQAAEAHVLHDARFNRAIRMGSRRQITSTGESLAANDMPAASAPTTTVPPPSSPTNLPSVPQPSPSNSSSPPPPPPPPPPALGGKCPDAAATLNLTNVYRNRHQAANVTWSDSLAVSSAAYAQKLAAGGCQLVHSGGKDYGENLMMWQTYPKPDNSCVGAIKNWYAEVKNYNFLAQRPFYENWPKNVGHFTQLVWRASTSIGCGVGTADVSMSLGGNKVYPGGCKVVVCRYKVPGNIADDMSFLKNVFRNTTAAVV